jgi:hypothetical protein
VDQLIERVAALDVHKASVVATVRTPGPAGHRVSRTDTFGTMTADLIALREWLQAHGVTVSANATTVMSALLNVADEEARKGAGCQLERTVSRFKYALQPPNRVISLDP